MTTVPAVTIRSLPEETHRALKLRAARNGRSTEAEIRDIIESAVRPRARVKLGTLLADIGRRAGFSDNDLAISRNERPAEPLSFE